MKPSETPLSVRVPDSLRALIAEAADVAGVNVSEFARDCLEAGARRQLEQHARDRRKLGFMLSPSACTHPPTAREQLPFWQECKVCGQKMRELT